MKRIIHAILASLLFVLLLTSFVAASSFKDVPSTHWAYKYVNPMVERGIVNGYEGNVFKPSGNVTRAEWAKLLTVTANIPIYEDFEEIMENACLDAKPTSWHAAYTVALLPYFDYSFTTDKNGETYFACEASKPVTRLEMAKSIVRVADYDEETPDYSLIKGFKDYSKIPSDDRKYIAIAVEKGIVSGFDDNTFRPLDNVTRAQAATMLFRTFIGEEGTVKEPGKPYKIVNLTDANTAKIINSTVDDNNLYFIDTSDNIIYKTDVYTGKTEEYLDPTGFSDEIGDAYFDNYIPEQLYYDKITDSLYLLGIYTEGSAPGKKPVDNGKFEFIYNITNPDGVELFCIPYESNYTFSSNSYAHTFMQTFVDKNRILFGNGDLFNLKTEKMDTSFDNKCWEASAVDYNILYHTYNNKIYKFAYQSKGIWPQVYDFSKAEFVTLTDNVWTTHIGAKDGYFYYFDKMENNQLYRLDLSTARTEKLDLILNDESIEFESMGNFDNLFYQFHVIDNDTFIFYDNSLKSFRKICKNESKTQGFVPPVFNTAEYYIFFKNFNISSQPASKPAQPVVSPYAAYAGSYKYSDSLDYTELSITVNNSTITVNGSCVCFGFDIITPAAISGSAQIVDGVAEFVVKDDKSQNVLVLVTPKEENVLGYNLKTVEVEFTSNRNIKGSTYTLYNINDYALANSYNTIKAHCPATYASDLTTVGLKLDGKMLTVDFESRSSTDEMTCRNASFSSTVDLSKSIIAQNKVAVPFADSWGNEGILTIEFNSGNGGPMLRCSTTITKYDSMALYWAEANPDIWLQ